MRPTIEGDRQRLVRVLNAAATAIPPGAAVYLDGMAADPDDATAKVYSGEQSPGDGETDVVFNGPGEIAVGKIGVCFAEGLVTAALDTADTAPTVGDEVGTMTGDWKLRTGLTGFRVLSVTSDERFAVVSKIGAGGGGSQAKAFRIVTSPAVVVSPSGASVLAWRQKFDTVGDPEDPSDDILCWLRLL